MVYYINYFVTLICLSVLVSVCFGSPTFLCQHFLEESFGKLSWFLAFYNCKICFKEYYDNNALILCMWCTICWNIKECYCESNDRTCETFIHFCVSMVILTSIYFTDLFRDCSSVPQLTAWSSLLQNIFKRGFCHTFVSESHAIVCLFQ